MRRHQERVYAVCRRLTGNDADALDATQEALLAIVRGLAGFHGGSSFATWAYRIAANAGLDEIRRRNRRPALLLDDLGADDVAAAGGARGDPSEAVAARIDVDRGLAQLREEFRVPVVLRDVAGLDYAEIAEALAIPPGTVRSRIARGRAQLAAAIKGTARDTADASRSDDTTGSASRREGATGGNQPGSRLRPTSG